MTELDYLKLTKEKPHMDPNQPDNSAVKPAFRSTEFWLSAVAMIVGLILASGVLSPDDPSNAKVLQVLGLVASILSSLGYTAARTSAKNRAVEVAGAIALEKVRASVPTPPAST